MLKVLALLFLFGGFGHSFDKKRLLLESELDIVQEFARLNKRLDEKDKEIEALKQALQTHWENVKPAIPFKIVEKFECQLPEEVKSGSTYVRWGRTTCPLNDTELVYHGYMASTAFDTTGGGSNFLCLSPDPQWSYYDESIASLATIKGVEYEFYAHHADGAAKFFGHDVYNDDAVCAVCHSRRSSSLMIPGRTECYSGWTKEYSGYLVSEFNGAAHESDFVCLDDRPESLVGGKSNDDEGVMYFVEASCGKSLECPPYINGRELTCVVCTK